MAGQTVVAGQMSCEAQEWVSGLADAMGVPWAWRSPEVLQIGPGDPWVAVMVHFDGAGEWRSAWFERSPMAAIQRGALGEVSTARIVHGVRVEMSAGLEWNSWLSWFEQQRGLEEPLPDWVVRGLMSKSLRREDEARSAAPARAGANFRRASRKAQEALMAAHAEEYQSLLEQFLVVEALSPNNGY